MWIRKSLATTFRFSQSTPKRTVQTINEIQQHWDTFSSEYNNFDYTPQTLYYSLLYMLEPRDAKNILEVACGTGKLLPIAINIKNPNANYLATDLSPQMVEMTKKNLKKNLELYDSKLSFEQWLEKNKIHIMVSNAEQPIQKPKAITGKFDRIISNCVLMLTQNPQNMLKNLNNEAETGCLYGLSVWGNKDQNNLMNSIRQSLIESGVGLPDERSNFHLYKKIPSLAAKCGWETVLNWQQNALFPALSLNAQKYKGFLFHQIERSVDPSKQEKVKQILLKKLQKAFPNGGINFSCELLILRKK